MGGMKVARKHTRRPSAADAFALGVLKSGWTTYPSAEVQYQIADLALLAAATRVDHAGEYFFLLRRGVERDAVPLDPATGNSVLAANENAFIKNDPICQANTLDGEERASGSGGAPCVLDAGADADPCDGDGDGHRAAACGGDDCEDAWKDIHPGGIDVCDGDGTVDQDDACVCAEPPPTQGCRSRATLSADS